MRNKEINKDIKTLDVNETFGVVENERSDYTISWFLVAKENFLTARILLENARYNHCVFFLQQCIECIIKGILLENKIIDEARIFNHSPEEALELFYNQQGSGSIDNCKFIKDSLKSVNDFELRLIKIVSIVNIFTDNYSECLQKKNFNDMNIHNASLSTLGLSQFCSQEDAVKKVYKMYYVNNLIYCFAILFNNVQQNTRYPMNECVGLMPSDKYKKTENLVKGLSSMMSHFDFILNAILAD